MVGCKGWELGEGGGNFIMGQQRDARFSNFKNIRDASEGVSEGSYQRVGYVTSADTSWAREKSELPWACVPGGEIQAVVNVPHVQRTPKQYEFLPVNEGVSRSTKGQGPEAQQMERRGKKQAKTSLKGSPSRVRF